MLKMLLLLVLAAVLSASFSNAGLFSHFVATMKTFLFTDKKYVLPHWPTILYLLSLSLFSWNFTAVDGFLSKKIKWFKSYRWFHFPMKNYNKQKQMYWFILLFNLFNSLMTDFTVTGSGTLILCNVQLTMLERFSAILAIYWCFTA